MCRHVFRVTWTGKVHRIPIGICISFNMSHFNIYAFLSVFAVSLQVEIMPPHGEISVGESKFFLCEGRSQISWNKPGPWRSQYSEFYLGSMNMYVCMYMYMKAKYMRQEEKNLLFMCVNYHKKEKIKHFTFQLFTHSHFQGSFTFWHIGGQRT